jgi:hypothetical protein
VGWLLPRTCPFLSVGVLNKQGRYLWQLIRQGDKPATDYWELVVTRAPRLLIRGSNALPFLSWEGRGVAKGGLESGTFSAAVLRIAD